MAESSEDIESGSRRLESPLRSEMETSLDKKLRNTAFKLALIEKAASTLGTMNFIWATVVLLGGFSTSLKSIDFWFVSVILVVEGLRILCRQGELATGRSRPLDLRPSLLSDFSLPLIYVYALTIQEYSPIACIVLSSLRIHKQQYGSDHNMNRNRALNLFYWLSIVESSLTLFGIVSRLVFSESDSLADCLKDIILSLLTEEESFSSALEVDGFDNSHQNMVLLFFYDTYCRCINGSVFDGLKMDFVSYSVELLQSIDHNEQLRGARLLSVLVNSDRLTSEKLRVIGTTPGVLARLIELLNWEKPQEREIRRVAGEIICKLVEIPRNRIRVMAIPESMESITSLLYDRNQREIHSSNYPGQSPDYYSAFSMLGKRILKILANDPDNHAKIGTNKGLLRKIIALEDLNANASESEIIRHLETMQMETQQDVRENNNGTDGFEAEHSDDPNLQSVDSQV